MIAVLQKVKADIFSRPLISLLIVVTVAAASTLLTLALATLMNLSAPYDRAFEELNAAHVWLYFDRAKIRERDIERIESLPGVTSSTGLQYSIVTRAKIHDTRVWVSLRAMPPQMPAINRLTIEQGRYLTADKQDLLASKDLNYMYQLEVNETVTLTREDGKDVALPVIGLAYNAMWDTYRTVQPPYIYVTEETLRDLYPDRTTWDWSMGLRLKDPQAVEATVKQIEDELRADVVTEYTDWRDVKDSAIFASKLNFIFLGAFSFFAILATILVVASSISSIVLSQFKQIGILKALGFAQGQILSLYLGQYLALSLVGTPLGLGLGFVLSPLPLRNVAASLSTPFRPALNPALILLVSGIVLGIVILAAFGAARRGARANTIRAITIGAEPPRQKTSWAVRLATWLHIPIVLILGLNDVLAKPLRTFMTGINLTIGVVGIIFGLTLNETLAMYKEDPSLVGIVYDATLTREITSDRKVQFLLERTPGVEAFYGEHLIEVQTLAGQSFKLRAVEGDLTAFPFRISKGRLFQPNTYEAVAGRGLLDWLGLKVGDPLTVVFEEREDQPITWHIVGQYPEPADAGQRLMVSLPTVAQHVKHMEPRAYFLKLTPQYNADELKRYLEPTQDSDLNFTLVTDIVPSEIFYLQIAMFALSAILIGIALVNVFNTSLLAMREKLNVVGVLKTVGMTPRQVIMMFNTTSGFLGLLAAGLGVPAGWLFTRLLLNLLSQSYGFDEVTMTIRPLYLAALVPFMVIVSMMGSLLPGVWAAKTPIVKVLRNE